MLSIDLDRGRAVEYAARPFKPDSYKYAASSPGPSFPLGSSQFGRQRRTFNARKYCSSPISVSSSPPSTSSATLAESRRPLPAYASLGSALNSVLPEYLNPVLTHDAIQPLPALEEHPQAQTFSRKDTPQREPTAAEMPSPGFSFRHRPATRTPPVSRKRDAYEAFPPSPDETWATFSASKKTKPTPRHADTFSRAPGGGQFRLPPAALKKNAETKARPKTLYRPPPPPSNRLAGSSPTPTSQRWKVTRISLHDALKGLTDDIKKEVQTNRSGAGKEKYYRSPSWSLETLHSITCFHCADRLCLYILRRCRNAELSIPTATQQLSPATSFDPFRRSLSVTARVDQQLKVCFISYSASQIPLRLPRVQGHDPHGTD